jgi:hypothetical protein
MWGVEEYLHAFLNSVLYKGKMSTPYPHLIGDWVGPRGGLGKATKRNSLPESNPGRAAHNLVTIVIDLPQQCK